MRTSRKKFVKKQQSSAPKLSKLTAFDFMSDLGHPTPPYRRTGDVRSRGRFDGGVKPLSLGGGAIAVGTPVPPQSRIFFSIWDRNLTSDVGHLPAGSMSPDRLDSKITPMADFRRLNRRACGRYCC